MEELLLLVLPRLGFDGRSMLCGSQVEVLLLLLLLEVVVVEGEEAAAVEVVVVI